MRALWRLRYRSKEVIQVNPLPVLGVLPTNPPAGAHQDLTLIPPRRGNPSPPVKIRSAVGLLHLYKVPS